GVLAKTRAGSMCGEPPSPGARRGAPTSPRMRGEVKNADAHQMIRISSIPGLPPLIACVALLLVWELTSRIFDLNGLPPAWQSLREVPAILSDRESLLDILDSIRRMV